MFKLICGSFHNYVFSQQLPTVIEKEPVAQQVVEKPQAAPVQANYQHRDDDCPNLESVKKLKGEIKRLRQELILNPKRGGGGRHAETSDDDQD